MFRSAIRHHQSSIIAIQCRWRQKLAKREFRRLKQVRKLINFPIQVCKFLFCHLQQVFNSSIFLLIYFLQEANEAGALRLAKNKLEKQLDDLTWRLNLEKRLRVLPFSCCILF